jgi:methanethiol S-methyltransferase
MGGPSDRLFAYSIMVLTACIGYGSWVLFATVPIGSRPVFRAPHNWSVAGILIWDTLLSFMFFLQHSGMVRRGFRARLTAHSIPPHYYPAVYSITSGIALTAVVLLWQPVTDGYVFVLAEAVGHPLLIRIMIQVGSIFAFTFWLWGAFALGGFDPCGLSPIQDYLGGRPERRSAFVVRGPYRWVRHPLYFSILLLFWLCPELTLDRLLFNVLWTAWIWIATHLEERDLKNEFGAAYQKYQQSVPMLIPRCRPLTIPTAAT